MFGLTWFRKLVSDTAIDLDNPIELEEFLRSVRSGVDGGEAPHRPLQGEAVRAPAAPTKTVAAPRRTPARRAPPSGLPSPLRRELDALLDEALLETFPASDPIAVSPR